jgi:hypothetical protein
VSAHCHDESRLVAHHRTYERFGHEIEEDVYVACTGCLAELGLYVGEVWYPAEEELEEEVVLEVVEWDRELYPYDADARPGHPLYRMDETWPPSMNEVWLRRGDGR